MSIFSSEFGDELLTRDGLVSTEELLEGKELIGLFLRLIGLPLVGNSRLY